MAMRYFVDKIDLKYLSRRLVTRLCAELAPNGTTVSFTHPYLAHDSSNPENDVRVDVYVSGNENSVDPIDLMRYKYTNIAHSGTTLTYTFPKNIYNTTLYVWLIIWKFNSAMAVQEDEHHESSIGG